MTSSLQRLLPITPRPSSHARGSLAFVGALTALAATSLISARAEAQDMPAVDNTTLGEAGEQVNMSIERVPDFELPPEQLGGSCNAGQKICDGNYCIPTGGTCCGYGSGRYCDSAHPVCCGSGSGTCGASSSDCSGGSSGSGSGGTCDPGTYQCGSSHCAPDDSVCCASVGREDKACPSGTSCNSDGTCSGSSGSGGGGTCPDGYPVNCGDGYCGRTSADCDGGSGGTTPGGGPGPSGGEEYCSGTGLSHDGCESIEACCTISDCYYITDDGSRFYCNGTDCTAAADETISYCEDQAGCSASPGRPRDGGTGAMLVVAVAIAGAGVRLVTRRRTKRTPHAQA